MRQQTKKQKGVNLYAKIRILKQITTRVGVFVHFARVSISMQRYEF